MSNLSQFTGARQTPKVLVNSCSTTGASVTQLTPTDSVKKILSGALTANVLKTMLTITGSGAFKFLSCALPGNSGSKTVRLKLTLDGVSVFDATSAATTLASTGTLAVGVAPLGGAYEYVPFTTSAVVEIANSVSETDAIAVYTSYETY